MAHSNQIREFLIRSDGLDLLDVYRGPEGVLTGSMRLAQEAREQADAGGAAAGCAKRERASASASARCSRPASPRCARNSRPSEREATCSSAKTSGREAAIAAQREAMALRRSAEAVRRRASSGRKGKP